MYIDKYRCIYVYINVYLDYLLDYLLLGFSFIYPIVNKCCSILVNSFVVVYTVGVDSTCCRGLGSPLFPESNLWFRCSGR